VSQGGCRNLHPEAVAAGLDPLAANSPLVRLSHSANDAQAQQLGQTESLGSRQVPTVTHAGTTKVAIEEGSGPCNRALDLVQPGETGPTVRRDDIPEHARGSLDGSHWGAQLKGQHGEKIALGVLALSLGKTPRLRRKRKTEVPRRASDPRQGTSPAAGRDGQPEPTAQQHADDQRCKGCCCLKGDHHAESEQESGQDRRIASARPALTLAETVGEVPLPGTR
jgi:hypothetical protein